MVLSEIDPIFLFLMIIFIFWVAIVVLNILFSILLKFRLKKEKLPFNNFGYSNYLWIIKNALFFGAFRKDYTIIFRERYYYKKIKDKSYRRWVDLYASILRIGLIFFNILVICVLIILIFPVSLLFKIPFILERLVKT